MRWNSDETSVLVAVHFAMKNIYQSCDLGCAVGWSNIDVSKSHVTVALTLKQRSITFLNVETSKTNAKTILEH